jgi:hypothetical protein
LKNGVITLSSVSMKEVWFGLWLVAVTAVSYTLWHEDHFFALSGTPVASITKAERDVSYRGEDDVRWRPIGGKNQPVFDGDKIATGGKSGASMDFGDGRIAKIGDETSVSVSTIRQTSGLTYILNLPKGSVEIKNSGTAKGKARFPIIIRSGGKDFLIEPGEEKAIVKTKSGVVMFKGPVPKKIQEIQKQEAPQIDVLMVADPEPVKEELPPPPPPPKVVAVKPKQPEPEPAPPPPPAPVLEGSEMAITSSIPKIFYTFDSLDAVKGQMIALKWNEPQAVHQTWVPMIELTNGSIKKVIELKKGGAGSLTWGDFGPIKADSAGDGLPCALLVLRGGAKITLTSGAKTSFSKETKETKICSYKDAAANVPLVVGMSHIDGDRPAKTGTFPGGSPEPLKYQIIASTAAQYLALMPLAYKSAHIKVARVPGFAERGVFVSKSGKVIAQLSGSGFSASAADKIMGYLGGEMVFKGARNSLYDATSLSADQLKEWISKSTQQGRSVYVHRTGTLLPISRDFLEERREVAAFIKTVASQMFIDKVEIIAYK